MPAAALHYNKYDNSIFKLCSNGCSDRQPSVGKLPFYAAFNTKPLLQSIWLVHKLEKS